MVLRYRGTEIDKWKQVNILRWNLCYLAWALGQEPSLLLFSSWKILKSHSHNQYCALLECSVKYGLQVKSTFENPLNRELPYFLIFKVEALNWTVISHAIFVFRRFFNRHWKLRIIGSFKFRVKEEAIFVGHPVSV